jgi:hypothetical protein
MNVVELSPYSLSIGYTDAANNIEKGFAIAWNHVTMPDELKASFRLCLNVDDVYYDLTEKVEDDPTSSANAYAVDDIILVKNVPTGISSRPTVDLLYRVILPISIGDAFVENGATPNVVHVTMDDLHALKQNINLTTPMKIDSATVNATTVEAALDKLNEKKINVSKIGSANGVASLGSDGKVPASELPSYIDQVIEGYYNSTDGKFYEESTYTTEITPESNKVYIDVPTSTTYRWGGTEYVPIRGDLVLGETSSTAYRGDRGKAAYDLSNANADRIDTLDANLAVVETDPVTYAHAVGEYMVFEDALYQAIIPIAVGDALVPNTNVLRIDMTDVIGNIQAVKVNYTDVAPAFNPTVAYAIKDVVTKDSKIWQFTSAHTAENPWNPAEVQEVTVSALIANATPNSLSAADIAALKALLD